MTSLYSQPPPHPPPPPAPPFPTVYSGRAFPHPPTTTSGYHLTPGKVAAVCFFSALFILLSFSLYLIIRFISSSSLSSPSSSTTTSTTSSSSPAAGGGDGEENQSPELRRRVVDFLPAIIFRSKGGREQECSICLGKFLQNEELRVLPICCHAFHSVCVDLWLLSNLSCPLCRSSIDITDSEFMKRITIISSSSSAVRSDSIRSDNDEMEEAVSVLSSQKEEVAGAPAPPGPWLAAEVAEQKSWLREYFDRFTSTASSSNRSISVLGSGRFVFTGSNRRSEVGGEGDDVGVEISEMFRFFSFI